MRHRQVSAGSANRFLVIAIIVLISRWSLLMLVARRELRVFRRGSARRQRASRQALHACQQQRNRHCGNPTHPT